MGNLFTDIFDSARDMVRGLGVYMLGRGIVTTAAIAAGFMGQAFLGASLVPYVSAVLIGGVALGGVMRLRDIRQSQDRMADIYRDEIAAQLGIDPRQVTRSHVHTLAYGDEKRGIAPNPILRGELDRQWKRGWMQFAGSLAVAAVSFGLISFGLNENVTTALAEYTGISEKWLTGTGIGVVTGVTSLIVHNGIDLGLYNLSALGNTTLHDRITRLDRDIVRGRHVTKEQVFALYAAADPKLGGAIEKRFGRSYDALSLAQKGNVLGMIGAYEPMQQIADDLNAGRLSAGSLAFIVTGQSNGVAASGIRTMAPAEAARAPEQQQTQTRFTDRVRPQTAEGLSHADREMLRRQSAELRGAMR